MMSMSSSLQLHYSQPTFTLPSSHSKHTRSFSLSPPPPPITSRSFRAKMSSDSLPQHCTVVGFGLVSVDFLATVDSYPNPDDKIRSTSLKVAGGGNAGNASTCLARLGLKPRLISKVADDTNGKSIIDELEAGGVDASFFVVSKEGNSPFTYIIVDSKTKTRTCIHAPGPTLLPEDLSDSTISSALDGAKIVFFDGRFPEAALNVAQEAARRNIPILLDAERLREGLDDLLKMADYAVCSAKFPQAWTSAPSIAGALVGILLRLPNMKFVIVTLGEEGCIMIERNLEDDPESKEVDVDSLLESLKKTKDGSTTNPTCLSTSRMKLRAEGIGTVSGSLYYGTAEKIAPSELVDTTGAGDAFIGATIYALCAKMPPEKMLPFAAQVAAIKCRALGARTGLPHHTDPRLTYYLSLPQVKI